MRPWARIAAGLVVAAVLGADAHAADLCGAAQRAGQPTAAPSDPLTATAMGVWLNVYGTFYAATGRQTEFVVLGAGATLPNGEPFPPHAFICPTSTVPRLFVTYPLLELIRDKNLYDASFLAIVMGHELGHRINDFDWQGRITTGGDARGVEDRADARGAFYAARSGFATRQLACDDVMDLFLNVEAGVQEEVRGGRKDALAQALRSFDVYESLYEAAAALVFWDKRLAKYTLNWVNGYMEDHGHLLAEFLVMEALARMLNGLEEGKWQRDMYLPGLSPKSLRCVPIYPTHTGLWDKRYAQAATANVRDHHPELAEAEKLLTRAIQLGTNELPAYSALSCVYFYEGRYKDADKALASARRAAPKDPPRAVARALDANEALIRWGAYMSDKSPFDPRQPEAGPHPEFVREMLREARGFKGSEALDAHLKRLKAYPKVSAQPPAPKATELCGAGPVTPDPASGPSTMIPLPTVPRSGGCPCGWTPLHTLVEPARPDERVATCIPAGWAAGVRYVHIQVPKYSVNVRLLMDDAVRGPLADLRTWDAGCKKLLQRGVSDEGHTVFAGICPDVGARSAVLFADDACRVTRAVSLGVGP